MKQEKVNIAELLQDAPKGTKLYSPICGECNFDKLIGGFDVIRVTFEGIEETMMFERYGTLFEWFCGECLLFPSKDVRDWGCFRAKYAKGVEGRGETVKALLKANGGIDEGKYNYEAERCIYFIDRIDNRIKCYADNEDGNNTGYDYILSTGTELKLEEKQPKFKVGDVVMSQGYVHILADDITNLPRCKHPNPIASQYSIGAIMSYADDSDTRLATSEEIAKWNKEVLEPNHLHYSTSKRKIIHWFLPFEKVVMRNDNDSCIWVATFFSYYKKDVGKFVSTANKHYKQCLPYNEQTAKLIGTTDDYDEE